MVPGGNKWESIEGRSYTITLDNATRSFANEDDILVLSIGLHRLDISPQGTGTSQRLRRILRRHGLWTTSMKEQALRPS